jgi:hypothetical protein
VIEPHHEEPAAAAVSKPVQAAPAWEVVGGQAPEAPDVKGKGKKKPDDLPIEAKQGSIQTALSYAGLVAALVVVLLGVILMVGSIR